MKRPSILAATGSAFAALLSLHAGACSSGGAAGPADPSPSEAKSDSGSLGPGPDDGGPGRDGTTDPPQDGGLPFKCANAAPAPKACPAISAAPGTASFCFRPQWPGVSSVEVYGGFGQATDWKAPFLTLTKDVSGTFTGTAPVADGSYPYLLRANGGGDGVVRDGQYFLDQENPSFVPAPPASPLKRSVSSLTVPQGAGGPLHHLKGSVVYKGSAQGCYTVALEAGELLKPGGGVLSEHTTANMAESAPDGTFDFPVAPGPFGLIVRFPFFLAGADAGYPDPRTTPSIGIARTNVTITTTDVVVDAVDVSYPAADYAAMSPTTATSTLPATFTFTVIPGSSSASLAVIGTNIAGNDPGYWSPFGSATSVVWDGTLGGTLGKAKLGTPYWWGAWQKSTPKTAAGTVWTEESLLFPITFH